MQRHTGTLDLKVGVDAEDYDAIASKEHLDPLELELRKLEDAAVAINKHMTYMRQREAAMRNTNGVFACISLSLSLSLSLCPHPPASRSLLSCAGSPGLALTFV